MYAFSYLLKLFEEIIFSPYLTFKLKKKVNENHSTWLVQETVKYWYVFQMDQSKHMGITAPISLDGPKPLDEKLSIKLEETMRQFGVFESDEELGQR